MAWGLGEKKIVMVNHGVGWAQLDMYHMYVSFETAVLNKRLSCRVSCLSEANLDIIDT